MHGLETLKRLRGKPTLDQEVIHLAACGTGDKVFSYDLVEESMKEDKRCLKRTTREITLSLQDLST
jgi:hypothetical protein